MSDSRLAQLPASLFKLIRQHTWRDQLWILLLTVCTFPLVYLLLELPKRIINEALGEQPVPETFLGVAVDTERYLLMLCLAFLALVLLNGALKYVLNIYRGVVGERMLKTIRSVLYQRLLHLPNERFRRTSSGELVPVVVAETEPLGGFIGEAYALPAFQGGLLLTYLVFIFNQNWVLGAIAIAFYPVQMVLIPRLQARINQLIKQRVRTVRQLGEQIEDSVSGIKDIQALALMPLRSHQFDEVLQRVYQLRLRIFRLKYFIKFFNNFLAKLTPFLFYLFGGYAVLNGELSLGALIAVLAAYQDLDGPWKELLKYYQVKEDIRVRYEQVRRQFGEVLSQPEPLRPDPAPAPALDLALRDVRLSAPHNGYRPLNAELPAGSKVLIVSQADSALEQLALTLAGLQPFDQGDIQLGGHSLPQLSLDQLALSRSLVLQRSHLFSGNLRINSALGILSHAHSLDELTPEALEAYGYDSFDACYAQYRHLIVALGLDQDFLRMGLDSHIHPDSHGELSHAVVATRAHIRQALKHADAEHYVSRFDPTAYNPHWSLLANMLFDPKLEAHGSDPAGQWLSQPKFRQHLEQHDLWRPLLDIGERLLALLLDMLTDVPSNSPLWAKFGFFRAEELPEQRQLMSRIEQRGVAKLPLAQQIRLLRLVMQLCPTQHRLGLLDEEICARAVRVRQQLLAEQDNACAYCLEGDYVPSLNVRENLLQGSLSLDWGNAQARVDETIDRALSNSELKSELVRLGMEYDVGVGGTAVNDAVRQRHAFLRALLTNPKLLIIHRATDSLNDEIGQRIRDLVLEADYTVVWLCQRELPDGRFTHRLSFDSEGLHAQSSDVQQSPLTVSAV